jgi:type II secretory pathway component PulL
LNGFRQNDFNSKYAGYKMLKRIQKQKQQKQSLMAYLLPQKNKTSAITRPNSKPSHKDNSSQDNVRSNGLCIHQPQVSLEDSPINDLDFSLNNEMDIERKYFFL